MKSSITLKSLILRLISDGYINNQEELADQLGVSKGYVSQIINGKRALSSNFVNLLCHKYPNINRGFLQDRQPNMLIDTNHERYIKDNWVEVEKSDINKSLILKFISGFSIKMYVDPDGSVNLETSRMIQNNRQITAKLLFPINLKD